MFLLCPLIYVYIEAHGKELADEAEYVKSIDQQIWTCLATACSCSADILRHDCVSAALVSVGYISKHFSEASWPPWDLTRGNVEENLLQLSRGARPSESVSAKVYDLMALEYSLPRLAMAVRLLGTATWSVTCTEQGHAVTSQMMKYHKEYSAQTLIARSLVAQSKVLFMPSDDETKLLKLQATMERFSRRPPEHLTGRQLFCQSLCALATARRKNGEVMGNDVNKRIFKKHAEQWHNQTARVNDSFEHEAVATRELRIAAIAEDMAAVSQEIKACRDRLRAELNGGEGPIRLSSARLSASERSGFDDCSDDCPRSQRRLRGAPPLGRTRCRSCRPSCPRRRCEPGRLALGCVRLVCTRRPSRTASFGCRMPRAAWCI